MAKKRVGKSPKVFRQIAVDRLAQCDNIVAPAKELGGCCIRGARAGAAGEQWTARDGL